MISRKFLISDPIYASRDPIEVHVRPLLNIQTTELATSLLAVRSFVERQLKPRLITWLFHLFENEKEHSFTEQADVLNHAKRTIDSLLVELKFDRLNTARIWKQLPEWLFGSAEIRSCNFYAVPFFTRYFATFRYFGLENEGNDDVLNLIEHNIEKDIMKRVRDSGHVDNLEFFHRTLEALSASPFGFGPLLNSAVKTAYVHVGRLYVESVIKQTNGLTWKQLESIYLLLRAFLESLPRCGCFSHERKEVVAVTLSEMQKEIEKTAVDLLTLKIYYLCVVGYPKTVDSITTLLQCMIKNEYYGREKMTKHLLNEVSNNLLNVAKDTTVMLDGYAACVDSLRLLDPSCAIMHRVCGIIKEYLKKRPDTVRKIITYITSDKRDQLAQHLGSNKGTILDEDEFAGTNDEFLPEAMQLDKWELWKPDPSDALPGVSGHIRESADVFNMLISVYGSKELFVKEYRKLLSERLTSGTERDTVFEKKYLEVLKQRFNEGELQQCDVMVKDIEDSILLDRKVMAQQTVMMNASVISSHFWPAATVTDKVDELPDVLEFALSVYDTVFKETKTNRTLSWMRARGFVDIDLELGGKTINRTVSNAHAATLYLFLDKEEWSAEDAAATLRISVDQAKKRLDWWSAQGLLTSALPPGGTSEVWRIVESAESVQPAKTNDESEDEDEVSLDDAQDAIESLEQFWMYTKSFIAQNENVKTERIHRMYKMFSSPSVQGPTLETVQAFLFRKVKAGLLVHQNGCFKIAPNAPPQ